MNDVSGATRRSDALVPPRPSQWPVWLRGAIPSLLRQRTCQPKPASLHYTLPPLPFPPLLSTLSRAAVLGRAYA